VLLRLNTPGGLMDSSREITSRIVAARVPVIAYVTPSGGRAASAGFFLLEAADVAAMAPGTNTGASSPVLLGREMDPVMRKKVENDASAWLRSIVSKRGRNADLAEKTVEVQAAGGKITVVANGAGDVISIKIAKEIVDPEDVEFLEDAVLSGVTQAIEQGKAIATSEMSKITGGMGVAGLGL